MESARHLIDPGSLPIDIAAKVEFLRRPEAYREGTLQVEAVETHMSWVFLTDRFAYKLKKPVRYEFLDFRSLDARRRNCEEEVRLNRRLAKEVYLGVVPLMQTSEGNLSLGGAGGIVDWLVKMQRLSRDRMLDQAIAAGRATSEEIRCVAQFLAEFYRKQPSIPMAGLDYRRRLVAVIVSNWRHLSEPVYGLPADSVAAVCSAQFYFALTRPGLFDQRSIEGHMVEAHGDLRPEHICLGYPPHIIDCLEFDRDLRILDPVNELSFLALECERLGAESIGSLVFDVYRDETGDSPAEELVAFYKSCWACLRAKIAVWHLKDHEVRDPERWPALARTYLAMAAIYAARLDRAPGQGHLGLE